MSVASVCCIYMYVSSSQELQSFQLLSNTYHRSSHLHICHQQLYLHLHISTLHLQFTQLPAARYTLPTTFSFFVTFVIIDSRPIVSMVEPPTCDDINRFEFADRPVPGRCYQWVHWYKNGPHIIVVELGDRGHVRIVSVLQRKTLYPHDPNGDQLQWHQTPWQGGYHWAIDPESGRPALYLNFRYFFPSKFTVNEVIFYSEERKVLRNKKENIVCVTCPIGFLESIKDMFPECLPPPPPLDMDDIHVI